MEIKPIVNEIEKKNIARYILEALAEWFGIPEAREEYIRDSEGKTFFGAFDEENPVAERVISDSQKKRMIASPV